MQIQYFLLFMHGLYKQFIRSAYIKIWKVVWYTVLDIDFSHKPACTKFSHSMTFHKVLKNTAFSVKPEIKDIEAPEVYSE